MAGRLGRDRQALSPGEAHKIADVADVSRLDHGEDVLVDGAIPWSMNLVEICAAGEPEASLDSCLQLDKNGCRQKSHNCSLAGVGADVGQSDICRTYP